MPTTSFAHTQFAKPIDQITADDLTVYFSTEREESLTLEFKSFYQRENDIRHKENGVLKTICGFLNSNGGLVIWGAPVGSRHPEGHKVFTGELSPVERYYTKDDFINKISNRLIPFAAPAEFHRVEVSTGKYVYLVDVPESIGKPHQFDNIYYMRLDGQTKVAPHYIIDALFKQVKIPVLSGYLRVIGLNIDPYHYGNDANIRLDIDVTIFNESKNLNDDGVYLNITTTAGTFIPKTAPGYLYRDRSVFVKEASSLVTYALTVQCSFHLIISLGEYRQLLSQEESIELMIVFGSKNSNTKRGDYKVTINNFELKDYAQTFEKPSLLGSYIAIEKNENTVMNDVWEGSEHERQQASLTGI